MKAWYNYLEKSYATIGGDTRAKKGFDPLPKSVKYGKEVTKNDGGKKKVRRGWEAE